MGDREERINWLRNEVGCHLDGLGMGIIEFERLFVIGDVDTLLVQYVQSESEAMQYLCMVGVPREQTNEYLDFAAKVFILSRLYCGETLTQSCQSLAEAMVRADRKWDLLVGLTALRGITVSASPTVEAPKCQEFTEARPVAPEPKAAPVAKVPECVVNEAENYKAAILRDAEAKVRSLLLRRTRDNICHNTVAIVRSGADVRSDGKISAHARFVCAVCGKILNEVSETYPI